MLHEASDSGALQTKIRCLQSISGGYSNTESFDGGGDAKQRLLPVFPQVRYVSERTVEVFTANTTGRIELHNILHPNMSRKLLYKVQSLDLTDGEPRHRVTSRDTVDRTPFSVHGTFSGAIGIAKSICTPELNKVSVLKIWQGKDPIVVLRVNQLDNALLAVTNFQYLPVRSSLFVLDLISQCKLTVEPRRVFKATHPHILDVCWLWDHPARLLLSTVDSIRLFDIRCPNRTEQALFLNHSVTHMASNRYRYKSLVGAYTLESYGEMFDKCKEDPESPMPLCWMAPMAEHVVNKEKDSNSMDTIFVPRCTVDTTRQQPILEKEGTYKCSLCMETRLEKEFENISEKHKDRLSFVFRQLGLDQNNLNQLCELQKHVELATNDDMVRSLLFASVYPTGVGNGMRGNKEDNEHRIQGQWKLPGFQRTKVTIYTYNARTPASKSSIEDLLMQARRLRYDVIGLAEMRRRQPFNAVYETGEELLLGICDSRGICVLVNTIFFMNIASFEQFTTRIGRLRLRRRGSIPVLTVFFVHAPTSNYDEEEVEAFYMDLQKFYREDHTLFKLPYNITSFDFAPVGYSGVLCLMEGTATHPKLVFAPFIAPDEGSAVSFEYAKVLEKIRVLESSDSIPFHLYQTMKLRLYNGMDKIDNDTPLL
ncbi:unnamed protein product [Angiostrongylus costaricensis]|uniref:WD_REPEATS_REGION domain-containing protein n=1 Tax=Angiostrongylus costaricensis TaxID=334426 RepID=A0A158PLR1_ANGCS|nr:unnamed protein product [Angiostrongylus costaricensis]